MSSSVSQPVRFCLATSLAERAIKIRSATSSQRRSFQTVRLSTTMSFQTARLPTAMSFQTARLPTTMSFQTARLSTTMSFRPKRSEVEEPASFPNCRNHTSSRWLHPQSPIAVADISIRRLILPQTQQIRKQPVSSRHTLRQLPIERQRHIHISALTRLSYQ